MSEAKHTPGPWRVDVDTDPEAAWERKWPTIQSKKYEVVGCEGMYGDYETDMANALLIAAAPDLLDALVKYMNAIDMFDKASKDGINYHGAVGNRIASEEIARAAIAKATKVQT